MMQHSGQEGCPDYVRNEYTLLERSKIAKSGTDDGRNCCGHDEENASDKTYCRCRRALAQIFIAAISGKPHGTGGCHFIAFSVYLRHEERQGGLFFSLSLSPGNKTGLCAVLSVFMY